MTGKPMELIIQLVRNNDVDIPQWFNRICQKSLAAYRVVPGAIVVTAYWLFRISWITIERWRTSFCSNFCYASRSYLLVLGSPF